MRNSGARPSISVSAYVCFFLMVGLAIAADVIAVQMRDIGMAISAVGLVLLGAFGLFAPIKFTVNLREALKPPNDIDPRIAYLAGLGGLLNIVGLAIRWLG